MLRTRIVLLALLSVSIVAVFTTSAAASVAYIDNNEVWVASDDGAQKIRLSGGENDWREVAQSDQGYIVGIRREAGKISQLASFTVWDPSGKVVHFGALSGDTGGLNAYPLSLDITPTGGNIVYGFSNYVYGYPVGTLTEGIYLKATADASTAVPLKITSAQYPTLVGTQIVGKLNDTDWGVQEASSIGSSNFAFWLGANFANHELTRTDVAANGLIAASEFQTNDTQPIVDTVLVTKWSSFGVTGSYIDDCALPVSGNARNVTISQDGAKMAWGDARGVVITGVPNLRSGGPPNCEMPGAPTVISATGSYPSYGPFNVAVAATPQLTIASKISLSKALKSGFSVTVKSAAGGKASVKLTIKPSRVGKKGKKPITLAKGSATVTAGTAKKIKVKFTKTGKKLKKKLKGKKATLTVTVGGVTTSKTIKLK